MKKLLVAVIVLVAAMTAPAAQAASSHALIKGSGSSWAANAINQWVADVANQGLRVIFTSNGAAQGRKDYANRANDFGVSDIPFRGADPTTGAPDDPKGRSFAYLPVAAGGTAFPYHISIGGQLVRNLRMSGDTLAKIFTSKITNWNDPQITRDNNGKALPSIPIIPVVHSEGAGVTNQFTTYLSKQHRALWQACNGGNPNETEYYPTNCGRSSGNQKALAGSDGVMNFIKSNGANGSIGMEEYSYPLLAGYPAAKILNSAGYYTLPTQYNVAVALTKAVIDEDPTSPTYLTQKLDKVYVNPDKRTYPLSSYVYAIIPTAANDDTLTTAKRQTLADFLYFSICQGQAEIGPIGYSSLPINLVTAGFRQIGKLKTADPGVDLTSRNVSTCHNPTFIAGKPRENYLAKIAPQPPACDKTGAGPCVAGVGAYNGPSSGAGTGNGSGSGSGTGAGSGSGTGSGTGTGTGSGTGTGTGAGAGTGTEAGAGAGTGAGGGAPAAGDDLGIGGATNGGDQVQAGAAVATTISADSDSGPSLILTILLVLLFGLVLAVPAGVGHWIVRNRGGAS